jgi:Restriction endonuclease
MTADEARAKIEKCDRKTVLGMVASIRANTPITGWDPGKAFEYVVLRSFQLEGADIRWPYSVYAEALELEQIDGVVYVEGEPLLIEAKDTTKKVEFEPVAKLLAKLSRRPPFVLGAIFSTAGFTDPAKILTRYTAPQRILLWEYAEFQLATTKRKLLRGVRAKRRHAVEYAMPDYNLLAEDF